MIVSGIKFSYSENLQGRASRTPEFSTEMLHELPFRAERGISPGFRSKKRGIPRFARNDNLGYVSGNRQVAVALRKTPRTSEGARSGAVSGIISPESVGANGRREMVEEE